MMSADCSLHSEMHIIFLKTPVFFFCKLSIQLFQPDWNGTETEEVEEGEERAGLRQRNQETEKEEELGMLRNRGGRR